MKPTKLILTAFAFAIAVFFLSCKKNSNDTVDKDTSGASDNALAENTSNDIVSIGSQATDNGSLTAYRGGSPDEILSSCANVSINDTTHIATVTFNGSTCMDGRVRSGTLIFNFSGSSHFPIHYRDPRFTCTVTSNNYMVDNNQVNIISKTITNTTAVGFNPTTTNETWHIVSNLSIVKASGQTITWNCDRVKTLLNTSSVYPMSDTVSDVTPINWTMARIGITGSAYGTRANGENYTVTVTSELIRDFGGCNLSGRHPFIQGTFDYAPANKPVRHFDFGSGTCDLNATVTINGITYNIII